MLCIELSFQALTFPVSDINIKESPKFNIDIEFWQVKIRMNCDAIQNQWLFVNVIKMAFIKVLCYPSFSIASNSAFAGFNTPSPEKHLRVKFCVKPVQKRQHIIIKPI